MRTPKSVEIAKAARPVKTDDQLTCQSVEWYSDGEARIVEVDGVRVTIRFVGRHGRRARIAITAPPGAVFRSPDGDKLSA